MKIAFLCNCLAPGRDGVGDYTAMLAGECERRGHEARMIALNDPHVDELSVAPGEMRLSPALSWNARVERAADMVSLFDPDFVSVQFVCYGFHPRGIDFGLAGRLREIADGRAVQMMFHELWIGAGKGAGLKERFTGALQRVCVKRALGALNVRAVHASNTAYVAMLKGRGIDAEVLPLFGAIPVPEAQLPARAADGALALGIFGSLHPVWPPQPLMTLLLNTGRKIVISHIGGMGAGGVALWEKMERDFAGVIEFRKLGEQPPERIAEFFRTEINFGIATTPWELIGKSASVAAMLEHGLPVIVNRDDWHFGDVADGAVSPLLIKMDAALPERLGAARRGVPRSRLPEVASQFLAALERAK
ncbi:MAG TPA: hypothetical protein VG733_20280 [Chthoniobacteraceae bacterium]|nr:hypothetical protein [Chthoniobacteraceae bacterium]